MANKTIKIASVCLNQRTFDFKYNLENILKACMDAKNEGATICVTPEGSVTGYEMRDLYKYPDTEYHCKQMLSTLLLSPVTEGMICFFSMPYLYNDTLYNCVFICLNHRVLCIRAKTSLAIDGNFEEFRYFKAWKRGIVRKVKLDQMLLNNYYNDSEIEVPFGDVYLDLYGNKIAIQLCQELWDHNQGDYSGIAIVVNPSASHHQLEKANVRERMMIDFTARGGGAYVYSNFIGSGGGTRVGYDGNGMIVVNGKLIAQSKQFSLSSYEIVFSVIDLDEITAYRLNGAIRKEPPNDNEDDSKGCVYIRNVNFQTNEPPTPPLKNPLRHTIPEEIAYGPAVWLWENLRRCPGATGFFLPLSGGADSASTAVIVRMLCKMISESTDKQVIEDAKRITGLDSVSDPKKICSKLLYTCYMKTDNNSKETEQYAEHLAEECGFTHMNVNINEIVAAYRNTVKQVFPGKEEKLDYIVNGGSNRADKAIQNLQARTRMVEGYLLAQIIPMMLGFNGFLLVLGSANLDEGLRGYLTKYDCSSADLNPIGGISKTDLKSFLYWAKDFLNLRSLNSIIYQAPTAELQPPSLDGKDKQTDEEDMGCTYLELKRFGESFLVKKKGVVSLFYEFMRLNCYPGKSPRYVADKVKFFIVNYWLNRHKMETITIAYHCEDYSNDSNLYMRLPFLVNALCPFQFEEVDRIVTDMMKIANEEANEIERRLELQQIKSQIISCPPGHVYTSSSLPPTPRQPDDPINSAKYLPLTIPKPNKYAQMHTKIVTHNSGFNELIPVYGQVVDQKIEDNNTYKRIFYVHSRMEEIINEIKEDDLQKKEYLNEEEKRINDKKRRIQAIKVEMLEKTELRLLRYLNRDNDAIVREIEEDDLSKRHLKAELDEKYRRMNDELAEKAKLIEQEGRINAELIEQERRNNAELIEQDRRNNAKLIEQDRRNNAKLIEQAKLRFFSDNDAIVHEKVEPMEAPDHSPGTFAISTADDEYEDNKDFYGDDDYKDFYDEDLAAIEKDEEEDCAQIRAAMLESLGIKSYMHKGSDAEEEYQLRTAILESLKDRVYEDKNNNDKEEDYRVHAAFLESMNVQNCIHEDKDNKDKEEEERIKND